ncbi:MAG: YdeI family protein [Roseivirga sp.]
MRAIALDCGLTEEAKWGAPCYTLRGKNVLMISAFKDYCAISFFKGALLSDDEGMLDKPGPNSQAARLLKFTQAEQIRQMEDDIRAYIDEALEIEKTGLKVPFKKNPEPLPVELVTRLDEDPVLKNAFEALTPGRQRGYTLHFSAPKQSKTRMARIDKCIPKILNGEGMHDKYKSMKQKEKP